MKKEYNTTPPVDPLPPIGPSNTLGWPEEMIDMYMKINEIIEYLNRPTPKSS
jgi:hypothetical protein